MEIEFEREALFLEVWASPISTLAKRYGLSDNGLRKVCLALDVPLPGRGHWAKIAAGHAIATPTLATTTGPTRTLCRPSSEASAGVPRPKDDPVLVGWLAFESDPANAIEVTEVLLRPHPLVVATRRAVREEIAGLDRSRTTRRRPPQPGEVIEPDWSSFARPSWHDYVRRGHIMELSDEVLPMRVSIESSGRALRICDALIKACVGRGMHPAVEPRALKLSCGGDWVKLRVSEKVDRAAARTLADQYQVRTPTGALRIFVIDRGEIKFEDQAAYPLEQQLGDVLRRIHYSMASLRFQGRVRAEERRLAEVARQAAEIARAAADERRQQVAESERCREAVRASVEAEERREAERAGALAMEANAWRQAETIRAYVAHVAASGKPATPEVHAWLVWATSIADQLDPAPRRLAPGRVSRDVPE